MKFRRIAAGGALTLLASCSFIAVRPGADNVRVAHASQVTRCTRVGETKVSVLEHVGFISRDAASVDTDLAKLARNSALDLGGDTIVPGEHPRPGEREFSVYRCLR